MVNCGVPKDGGELKLKSIKLGDGKKKPAHSIRLLKSALTLFLQSVIAVLRLFVAFHQGVIAVDVLILVNGLHGIFVDALLDETRDHIHFLEEFLSFGINRRGIHQLVADEPAVLKECLSVDHQLA